jgi:hypothetical protein
MPVDATTTDVIVVPKRVVVVGMDMAFPERWTVIPSAVFHHGRRNTVVRVCVRVGRDVGVPIVILTSIVHKSNAHPSTTTRRHTRWSCWWKSAVVSIGRRVRRVVAIGVVLRVQRARWQRVVPRRTAWVVVLVRV